jgi:hypothetical protein
LAGAARLVLADGVALLDPEATIFAAMPVAQRRPSSK